MECSNLPANKTFETFTVSYLHAPKKCVKDADRDRVEVGLELGDDGAESRIARSRTMMQKSIGSETDSECRIGEAQDHALDVDAFKLIES